LLRLIRELPHPDPAAADEMDAAIASARRPIDDRGVFDEDARLVYPLDTNAISDLIHSYAGIEKWLSELSPDDRIVTCTIVRGEILFGIFKLPEGRRRAQLEARARKILDGTSLRRCPAGRG